ncbi:hypothetical protein BJY00DRAFT_292974 [Aspergillus carlsbadensis]|nr:hypothetical protein BJY00DRAFT_292974 [Aspergillus carlsbadensis]
MRDSQTNTANTALTQIDNQLFTAEKPSSLHTLSWRFSADYTLDILLGVDRSWLPYLIEIHVCGAVAFSTRDCWTMSSSGLSNPENDDELTDIASITPRANRGTRYKALRALRSSLSYESVEVYKNLFEQPDDPNTEENTFTKTQNGIVIWTTEEKQLLYQALDRKGINGIHDIAAAIGSKSDLEVQEYLRLLEKGLRRQHVRDARLRTAVLGDIPAAAEISDQCRESLDQHAELLCLAEQAEEDIEGKLRHGRQWIVDQEIAEQLDSTFGNEDEELPAVDTEPAAPLSPLQSLNETEPTSALKAPAEFFNMTKWIILSERLFMNFGGPRLGDNWVNVAFEKETPSITADAFTIFHDIARALTRRLVHATHFFARSRVQKYANSTRPPARVVTASDVRRAALTLNMKTDSSDFWVGLSRRCSLDVVDERHKRGWNPVSLDHDEVEDLLSRRELPGEPYKTDILSPLPRRRSSGAPSGMFVDSLDLEGSEDEQAEEHAEAIDRQNSAVDELRCWTVLGKSPPETLETQLSDNGIPRKPTDKRKSMEELIDWRERTLPRNDWEVYGHETENINREFHSRHKRPRLATLSPSPSPSRSKSNHEVRALNSRGLHVRPSSRRKYRSRETILNSDSELDSDPAFQPASPEQKSKSRFARTSSRKCVPVSYAPQQLFDLDVEMDVDAASEHDDSHILNNRQERGDSEGAGEGEGEDDIETGGVSPAESVEPEDERDAGDEVGVESRDDFLGPDNNRPGHEGGLSSDSDEEYQE